jgi:hypothetical protein
VSVTTAAEVQVSLSKTNATNTCPGNNVNLNNYVSGTTPVGFQVVWFTDPGHSTAAVDPAVQKSGTYYAFYYHPYNGCFKTSNSTSKIDVIINSCSIKTDLIVFLQGAMGNGQNMRNDLQTYFGPGSGLLPVNDPYDGRLYESVNNEAGPVGKVVDWVRVELHSVNNPSTILESQTLLLRPDGHIVDVDGNAPNFKEQAEPLYLVIKHRNHLPVVSNPILNFNVLSQPGIFAYDFTSNLNAALGQLGDSPQMINVAGKWCMIAGDIQADFVIDNVDTSIFNSIFDNGEFDTYSKQDLNLDGAVDNVDLSFIYSSFNAGYYSTLINF